MPAEPLPDLPSPPDPDDAVSLGGDSDTLGCITGAVAEAYFGPLEADILATIRTILPPDLWSTAVRFCRKHGPAYQYP